MRRSVIALLALAAVLSPATPTAAQDIVGGGINQSWTSTQLLLNSEKHAWAAPECVDDANWSVDCNRGRAADSRRPDRSAMTAAPDTAPAIDPAQLTFRPSRELRRRHFAQFIAKTRAVDPAGARELETFLATDVIDAISNQIAPIGLHTDNVADAMALYVMEAWEVVAGKVLPPSRTRALAVRRQMVRAIAATPTFARASDAVKQEMAEAMLVQAALVSASAAGARQNGPDQVAAVRAAVKKGSRAALGFDLGEMTLTEAGLREGRQVSSTGDGSKADRQKATIPRRSASAGFQRT